MRSVTFLAKRTMLRWYAGTHRVGARRAHPANVRRALVVPPASPGGLGDDALMRSLCYALTCTGFKHIHVGRYENIDRWDIPKAIPSILLPSRTTRSWLRFLRALRPFDSVFIVGADMIDGAYGSGPSLHLLQIADLTARLGIPTTLVGASFNGRAPEIVNNAIRSLSDRVELFARDDISHAGLQRVTSNRVQLSADIAFLLPPASAASSPRVAGVCSWVERQRESGKKLVIGCNLNAHPLSVSPTASAQLVARYSDALQRVHRLHGPIAVVLISHDRRAPYSDVGLLNTLSRRLPKSIATTLDAATEGANASEIKAIVARCDLLLTGRMHLAIAALGSSVPVACIGYQAKFEGLLRHFETEEMVLDSSMALESGRLDDLLSRGTVHNAVIKHRIRSNLPRVLELSWSNVRKAQNTRLAG